MDRKKRVIVISGPTASGKTAVGVELCLRIGGEVISADSMQIYRTMDIGTAKVTAEEMRGVPHHMIDVADPWEDFSVSRYVEMASQCADDILARGKTPVIVGGTGLYIDSLLSARSFACRQEDGKLRQALSAQYDAMGGEAFMERLREVDPQRAALLHPSDKKRVVRALEVFMLTGKTITQHDLETQALPPRYESARFALNFADRARLYERIDRRVDEMVERGLFEETAALLKNEKISSDCTAMQAIGYKEAVEYIRGEMSAHDAAELIKQGSRRYAKRQLTWLRRDKDARWILWQEKPDVAAAADAITDELDRRCFFNF
jgi:tRNA dimethylallyltransferase